MRRICHAGARDDLPYQTCAVLEIEGVLVWSARLDAYLIRPGYGWADIPLDRPR